MDNNQMIKHWQEICGDAPESFRRRAQSTLYNLRSQSPRRRMKPALAMALGLTLLLGSAFALSQLGLLDSLNPALRKDLLPEATQMVKSNIPQQAKQPKLASFNVEEAIYDGHQVYLTLAVSPSDGDKTLLMDQGSDPGFAHDWYTSGNTFEGESFGEKAKAENKALVQAEVWSALVDGTEQDIHLHSVRYDEDSLRYTLAFPASGDAPQIHLKTIATDLYQAQDDSRWGSLDFSLSLSPHIRRFAAKTPLPLPKAGLILTQCQMETTPIASYLILRYDLAPDATPLQGVNLEDGIWAHWLDESGQPRESSDHQNTLNQTGSGGVELVQSFGALKEVPGDVTLSFYNGMTKERFDQITLTLSPKEDK